MRIIRSFLIGAGLVAAFTAGPVGAQGARTGEPIQPLPERVTDVDPAKVRLGARLFADKRLSGDGSVSCQSCHLPHAGGADPRRHSVGAFGAIRDLNSPPIANLVYMTVGLNWTGRTQNLDKQIAGSMSNKSTMNHNWESVLKILAADPEISADFKRVYGGEVNQANVSDAIVSFERAQITPSPFDKWLRGDDKALTKAEMAGYRKFKEFGCVGCHSGPALGGQMFAKLGVHGDYFAYREAKGRGALVDADKGRYEVTKKPEDLHVFRVPQLRNIALTAPYFHDGSVESLHEAVQLMGRHQLGRELSDADVQSIVTFLHALTGTQFAGSKVARR